MIDATGLLRLYAGMRAWRLARQDPAAVQERTLLALVGRAARTRFGREHGFAAIRSVEDYQRRVPLRFYAEFWEGYWSDAYPAMEDRTWPGRVPYLAFTSGTAAGTGKLIPVSRHMVAANLRAALEVLVHHLARHPASRVLGGKSFLLGGSTDLVPLAHEVLKGDLSGIAANEVPLWARPWSFPPREEGRDSDWDRKIDRLARLSLGQDIRAISGTPGWVLLFLERAARAAGCAPMARELYPNLEIYVHGGVGFRPYRDRFRAVLEGGSAEPREVYAASEGFVAIADRGDGEGLRLLLDNGLFFEFVPPDDLHSAAPRRYCVADAEPGRDYALVLTSCAGLWSYVLGDVVRLVDLDPPRLLVVGRLSYWLNAFGEHLSGEKIEDATLAGARAAGVEVAEYAMGARFDEGAARGRHVVVAEFTMPCSAEAVAVFARAFDRALAAGSVDYAERRAGDIGLSAPEVLAVPPGFFAAWMRSRGRMGGQNKVPRVVTDDSLLADLLGAAAASPERIVAGRAKRNL